MLTVADALQLDAFTGAELVAGGNGADQPIAWVYNTSVPDAYNWINGGELVLTTAANMPPTLAAQLDHIRAFINRGAVGLVVTVGRHIDRFPDEWCQLAEAHNFPLLSIPYAIRFVDVARAVNERISQDSIAMVRRALHIHQVLSQLVLDERELPELADELAALIGQSISIETDRFEALASANIAEVDEARRYTLEHGRTNPELIATLERRGVLAQIRETRGAVQLPRIPEVGLEMERILAPIVVHGDIYGYMWIIADGKPLTDIDRMAIESGSTVAALMLLHQEAVQSAEASLKGNLLAQLIEGDGERQSVLHDQSMRYGVDLNAPYRMLLVDTPAENGTGNRLYRRVNRFVTEQGWKAVAGQFAGQVVLLLDGNVNAVSAAEHLWHWLDVASGCIGISGEHTAQRDVADAYNECHEVLTIARRIYAGRHVASFDDLGYIHALYHAGAASLHGNPYVKPLRLLRKETTADLFNTLEVYLDHGGNGVATAEALHIHRSTLNYRLQRITQIAAVDLTDPATRLNMQVTLKQMRLFD
ncbi:MAG: PucR family transcriptional regulator ligand-binding domain-containing protein [Chloroflexota bacterium]